MPVFRADGRIGRTVQRLSTTPAFRRIAPRVVPPVDRAVSWVTGGRANLSNLLVPTLLLRTVGHRSGLVRETTLACVPLDDGWYLVGSNFGREHHPAWTTNLLAEPDVSIRFRGRDETVRARKLAGEERIEVWPDLLEVWPAYDEYLQVTDRRPRVFHLTPR